MDGSNNSSVSIPPCLTATIGSACSVAFFQNQQWTIATTTPFFLSLSLQVLSLPNHCPPPIIQRQQPRRQVYSSPSSLLALGLSLTPSSQLQQHPLWSSPPSSSSPHP
ncbi:hypothetical protein PIB30_058072 [Stylosanthes scabra]|uniref:Uncharacterized protein n=1 Tax=Stylosanthes scabra TaxID=79078 RepID=A0ABU6QJJ6_9FABA|nr:hypothetical protein [Stylosanthes scabra]